MEFAPGNLEYGVMDVVNAGHKDCSRDAIESRESHDAHPLTAASHFGRTVPSSFWVFALKNVGRRRFEVQ